MINEEIKLLIEKANKAKEMIESINNQGFSYYKHLLKCMEELENGNFPDFEGIGRGFFTTQGLDYPEIRLALTELEILAEKTYKRLGKTPMRMY